MMRFIEKIHIKLKQYKEILKILLNNKKKTKPGGSRTNQAESYNAGNAPTLPSYISNSHHEIKLVHYNQFRETNSTIINIQDNNTNQI